MTQCPDHPHVLGATLGHCVACQREAVTPERARQLAQQARAVIPKPTHRPEREDNS